MPDGRLLMTHRGPKTEWEADPTFAVGHIRAKKFFVLSKS